MFHIKQQHMAQEILTNLKEHPDAWTRVDTILEFSTNEQTKYFALQILENVIKTRWKVLPRQQCDGGYMYSSIIEVTTAVYCILTVAIAKGLSPARNNEV